MTPRTCARDGCATLLNREQRRYCSMACYAEAKRGTVGPNAGRTFPHLVKVYCPAGHRYSPANTLTWSSPDGKLHRKCRACHCDRMADLRARQRAARDALLYGSLESS